MSKHLGNVVSPAEVLTHQGADAVRWYFYTASMPWLPSRFSGDAVSELQRKFMGTLWNTYAFYVLYADIDGFDPSAHSLKKENLSFMDRWVLSRLMTLIHTVDEDLDALKITEAGRELQAFVEELSNWYVRRCRDRYWGSEMTDDKEAAYMTLYTVLKNLALLSAPFVPFMSEEIYQNIVRRVEKDAPESVHLCSFPAADDSFVDKELEEDMEKALAIVTLGRSARNEAAMKIRQPLAAMYVQGAPLPEGYKAIIAEELNVKEVRFVEDASGFISYSVKPQLRTLGPKYGKLLGAIRSHMNEEGAGDRIVSALKAEGRYAFEAQGSTVELTEEDVLVSSVQKAGLVSAADNGLTVVLDTNLTPALIEEGLVRELTSKLQTMRKEAGFEVADHIRIGYAGGGKLAAILAANSAAIGADTLADAVEEGLSGYEKEWNINGETVTLSVEKR